MSDRTVHAEVPGFEQVVRYDRSGKWYIEIDGARKHVSLGEAAKRALELRDQSGVIHLDRPGGRSFDRRVRSAS
jgi:hypothetical protein